MCACVCVCVFVCVRACVFVMRTLSSTSSVAGAAMVLLSPLLPPPDLLCRCCCACAAPAFSLAYVLFIILARRFNQPPFVYVAVAALDQHENYGVLGGNVTLLQLAV